MLSWLLPASLLRQDGVYPLVYWATGALVLIAEAAALVLLVRTRPPRAAALQEVAWALVPVLLLIGLGVLGTRTRDEVRHAPIAAMQDVRGH
jgi:hypothetical protein